MTLPRLLRWSALVVAVVLGLVAILLAALLVFQPTLELTRVKIFFEEQLTDFVEAPVTLESVWLKPSLWPTVGLRGLVIESSDTQSRTGFARLDSAELQLGLLPLLKGEIRVRRLAGEGVELRVRRNRDKSGNWPTWTTVTYDIKELKGIELRDITAEYVDRASGDRILSRLDRLEAEIGENDPLHLEMEGRIGENEYSLTASGPTLDEVFQRESWPLELDLEVDGDRVELEGELDPRPAGLGVDLMVTAEIREPDRVAARLGLEIPPLGRLELESRLTAIDRVVTLSELEARLGSTDISGSVALDLSHELPKVSGQLTAGYLDLDPWFGGTNLESAATAEELSSAEAHDLSSITKILAALSADVALSVDRLGAPGPEIGGLSAKIRIRDGSLSVPFEIVVAGNTVEGRLEALGDKELHLLADLEASEVELDELVRSLADSDGIGAAVSSLRLHTESHGTSFEELIERLAFELRAAEGSLTYGLEAEGEPIAVEVESLVVKQRSGDMMRLESEGSLLDEAMTLSLDTGNLTRLLATSSIPIEIELRIAGAEARAAGTVESDPATDRLGFDFEIRGERVGDLSGLLGISAEADLPYKLQGRLDRDEAATRLRLDNSLLGQTELSGELTRNGEEDAPLLSVDIRASAIDPEALAQLVDPVIEVDAADDAVEVDAPVMPSKARMGDADIHLVVDRWVRQPVDVTDLEVSIRVRDGKVEESPFSLYLGDTSFRGALGLDLTGDLPEARLRLTAEQVDLGNLLAQEELVADIELTVERLNVDYVARGSTPSELFSRSEIDATLSTARWLITEPLTDTTFEVLIDRAEITGPELQPLELEAAGSVNETPFTVSGRLDLPTSHEDDMEAIPVSLTVRAAGAHLDVSTAVDLPFDRDRVTLGLELSGERLDSLSPLVGIGLPSVGPYRLSTDLEVREGSYNLPNLEVRIDDSDLQAMISLAYGDERPHLTVELTSSRLDLDDILGKKALAEARDGRGSTQSERSIKKTNDEPREPVITAELLRSADASITVRVESVQSLGELRGGGELNARLEDGHLEITPLTLVLPEGSIELEVDVTAIDDLLDIAFQTRIGHLDYGALLERLDPESDVAGALTLNSHLQARSPSLEEFLVYADGHLDFTLYPKNYSTALFDLWATHLLAVLMPTLDSGGGPQLNCVVGRFTIESGLMTPDALLIDTSRIRVRGKGKIDLKTGKLNLTLKPRPKKRGLISLATPVRVTGRLDDPSIYLSTSGLARTLFRLSVWFWTAYLELLRRPLPTDGADICVDPPPRADLQLYPAKD